MPFLFKLTKRQALARAAGALMVAFAACSRSDAPTAPFEPSSPLSASYRSAASVTVTPSSVTDTVGQTTQMTAVVRDSHLNIVYKTVLWSSKDTSVASVSTSG